MKFGEFGVEVFELYTNIGVVYLEIQNFGNANEFFNNSLKCDTNKNYSGFMNLAKLYSKQNDSENAINKL